LRQPRFARRLHLPFFVGGTDLLPGGRALQFTFEMGVKSVITKPSSTMKLPAHRFYETSASPERPGRIPGSNLHRTAERPGGGRAHREERPKSLVRFRLPWE